MYRSFFATCTWRTACTAALHATCLAAALATSSCGGDEEAAVVPTLSADDAAKLCTSVASIRQMGKPLTTIFPDDDAHRMNAGTAGFLQSKHLLRGEEHVLLLDFVGLDRESYPKFPYSVEGDGVLEGMRWGLCPSGDFDAVAVIPANTVGEGRLVVADPSSDDSIAVFTVGDAVALAIELTPDGDFVAELTDGNGYVLHSASFLWEIVPHGPMRVTGNVADVNPESPVPRMTVSVTHGDLSATIDVVSDGTTWHQAFD